jgi:hypothetical protein
MARPTWEELVELEPGLGLLEHEILKVQDWPERPYFCAHAYWYGDIGFKAQLVRLVGIGRRGLGPPTDLHEGEENRLHFMEATEMMVRTDTYSALHAAIREQEEREGRGVLWTSPAYDVAYEHLYNSLPDCRHPGSCWSGPRIGGEMPKFPRTEST